MGNCGSLVVHEQLWSWQVVKRLVYQPKNRQKTSWLTTGTFPIGYVAHETVGKCFGVTGWFPSWGLHWHRTDTTWYNFWMASWHDTYGLFFGLTLVVPAGEENMVLYGTVVHSMTISRVVDVTWPCIRYFWTVAIHHQRSWTSWTMCSWSFVVRLPGTSRPKSKPWSSKSEPAPGCGTQPQHLRATWVGGLVGWCWMQQHGDQWIFNVVQRWFLELQSKLIFSWAFGFPSCVNQQLLYGEALYGEAIATDNSTCSI